MIANTCSYVSALTDLTGSFRDRCYQQPRISSDITIQITPAALKNGSSVRVIQLQFEPFDMLATDQIVIIDSATQQPPIQQSGVSFTLPVYAPNKQLLATPFTLLAASIEIRFISTSINSNRALALSYTTSLTCPTGMELKNISSNRTLNLEPAIFNTFFQANYPYATATCLLCPPGFYRSDLTNQSCVDSAEGEYVLTAGKSAPSTCLAGTYSNQRGQAVCKPCPTGHYQPNNASRTCLPCPKGSAFAGTGATACLPCAYPNTTTDPPIVGKPHCRLACLSNHSAFS